MHVPPAKHSYAWLLERQTPDKVIPMCHYALQITQWIRSEKDWSSLAEIMNWQCMWFELSWLVLVELQALLSLSCLCCFVLDIHQKNKASISVSCISTLGKNYTFGKWLQIPHKDPSLNFEFIYLYIYMKARNGLNPCTISFIMLDELDSTNNKISKCMSTFPWIGSTPSIK